MQVVLVMFRSDGERRSFSVVRDMTVIGRREDCDLRIPLGDVSRKHCRLIKDGDALRIEDLGSSNGTFVNGERVQEAELNAGDTIQVGPVVFALQIDGVPADEDLQPDTGAAAGAAALSDENAEVEAAPEEFGYLEPTAQSDAGVAAFAPQEEIEELEELEPIEAEASEDEFAPPEELEPLAETEDVLEEFESEPEAAPAANPASAETEEFNPQEVIEPDAAHGPAEVAGPVEIDEGEFEIIDEESPAEDSAVNVDIDFGDNKRDQ